MASTKPDRAAPVAFGGMMAAAALVILCMGGLIPIATFVCPMLCMLLLDLVQSHCGRRIGWAWYVVVALLGVLLCPDREMAAVFLFLGYYPILRPRMEQMRFCWMWKLLLFNTAILLMYVVLIYLMGMEAILYEFRQAGAWVAAGMLVLGNGIFLVLDWEMRMLQRKRCQRKT